MRALVDAHIPHIQVLEDMGCEVEYLEGVEIDRDAVLRSGAEILLVRTLTAVNQALLAGSAVRFVGSPTAGCDHLDVDWLKSQGIAWAYAPGCNADAVVAHVLSAMNLLEVPPDAQVGIVGMGAVGSALSCALNDLHMSWQGYDPWVAPWNTTDLDSLAQCQVLSLHPALVTTGEHPSTGLISDAWLKGYNGVLINTSRAHIVERQGLRKFVQRGGRCALDVWYREPVPESAQWLASITLPTPHIAGYSRAAKRSGSLAVLRTLGHWLGRELPADRLEDDAAGAGSPESWSPQRIIQLNTQLRLHDYARDFLEAVQHAPDPVAAVENLRHQAAQRD